MSKRREWWLTGERKIVCNSHESAANCNEGVIHVREVLPGDEPLACQLGDANLELESLKQRHAKLLEVLDSRRVTTRVAKPFGIESEVSD